jgi:hypothetical protein
VLIVVADHGIALRPNIEHWRRIAPDTVGEVAAVPLFVKAPVAVEGTIDDRRALTIDIVPTIADVLQYRVPWDVEGQSQLGPPPHRTETTTTGPVSEATYGVDGSEKLAVAARNSAWLPTGDPFDLRPPGSPDLRGQSLAQVAGGEAGFRAVIDRPEWYEAVRPESGVIPVRITGTLLGAPAEEEIMGVAVNGIVAGLTQTYVEDTVVRWQLMIPPQLLQAGANTLEVFWVEGGQVLTVETG